MSKTRIFQADANGHSARSAMTPRGAAIAFFDANRTARKCRVYEGFADGRFFTIEYGQRTYPNETAPRWPRNWKDVTKRTLASLPDTADQVPNEDLRA